MIHIELDIPILRYDELQVTTSFNKNRCNDDARVYVYNKTTTQIQYLDTYFLHI